MLINELAILKFFQLVAEIGCKVTHFLSLTQTFLRKTCSCLHKQGTIVQKTAVFVCVTNNKNEKIDENMKN